MVMKKLIVISLVAVMGCGQPKKYEKTKTDVLNLYSQRHYDADKKVFDIFTEQTGIQINLIRAGADELITRMEQEGDNSPADVFFTVDAARLNRAKQKGLLQPVDITTNLAFSDPEKYWHGVTYRARVIAYDKAEVSVKDLSTYEDLADKKWQGKILIRSSSSEYNQSLLASMLYANGEVQTEEWAEAIVKNMARSPEGGDRDQVKAIAAGIGTIAITNTYYVGLLLHSSNPEEVRVGKNVGIFFPNQEDRGTHVNVSGVGITKNAPNKVNAIKFIEFVTSEEMQKIYANESFEYPVNTNVPPHATVAAWGKFKVDVLGFAKDISYTDQAIRIFDRAGWE